MEIAIQRKRLLLLRFKSMMGGEVVVEIEYFGYQETGEKCKEIYALVSKLSSSLKSRTEKTSLLSCDWCRRFHDKEPRVIILINSSNGTRNPTNKRYSGASWFAVHLKS